MSDTTTPSVQEFAEACVDDMGDIFWDFDPTHVTTEQYSDPYNVALASVQKTLAEFSEMLNVNTPYISTLQTEYESVVAALPESPSNALVRGELVKQLDWTDKGAEEVLQLARRYGVSILRNALALAEALEIEDGDAQL